MTAADSNYSINPWMRTVARPGDNVDPSPLLDAVGVVEASLEASPLPPPAGYTLRLTGMPRDQLRVEDVLQVGPAPLMQDTPTRQDSGMQGTLRPSQGLL